MSLVTGCASDIKTDQVAATEAATEATAEKEAKIQEALAAMETHTAIAEDSNGYKQKITIRIGKWIRGTEQESLQQAWESVGGTGSVPLTDTYTYKFTGQTTDIAPDDAAYVIGTLSVENATPEYDAKNFQSGDSRVIFQPSRSSLDEDTAFKDGFVKWIQYGDGTDFEEMDSVSFANPNMTSNNWGPVPFVIGADAVFNPKYPDGTPKLDQIEFQLYGNGAGEVPLIKIGKSW